MLIEVNKFISPKQDLVALAGGIKTTYIIHKISRTILIQKQMNLIVQGFDDRKMEDSNLSSLIITIEFINK